MGKPRYEAQHDDYARDVYFLYDTLSKFSSDKRLLVHFLRDFLTKSELRILRRRWHIACLLSSDHDVRLAASMAKSSTSTVIRVKRMIEEGVGGFKRALEVTEKDRNQELAELAIAKTPQLPALKLDYRTKREIPDTEKFKKWVFGSGGPD